MTDIPWRLVIHGGAGSERIAHGDPEHEANARQGLSDALDAGALILSNGGSAVDTDSAWRIWSRCARPVPNAAPAATVATVALATSTNDPRRMAADGTRRAAPDP